MQNNHVLILAEVSAGIYNHLQLKCLSNLAKTKLALIKATEDQRLALVIDKDKFDEVSNILDSVDLKIRNYKSGNQPMTCIGKLCPDFKQDSLNDTLNITNNLEIKTDSEIKIGFNGCDRKCISDDHLDIAFNGSEFGYTLSIAAHTDGVRKLFLVAYNIPNDKIKDILKNILLLYDKNSKKNEVFTDFISRVGFQDIKNIIDPNRLNDKKTLNKDINDKKNEEDMQDKETENNQKSININKINTSDQNITIELISGEKINIDKKMIKSFKLNSFYINDNFIGLNYENENFNIIIGEGLKISFPI